MMEEKEKIAILTTGGTIDKVYNPITGEMCLPAASANMTNILTHARLYTSCGFFDDVKIYGHHNVNSLCSVDSLEMTDFQREGILETCVLLPNKRIVIVHGTDTMCKTARLLAEHLSSTVNSDKTIVLTGAMVPESVKDSDASFNVGFALAAVQLLPSGVFVAMNGKVFNALNVEKDTKRGKFQPQRMT